MSSDLTEDLKTAIRAQDAGEVERILKSAAPTSDLFRRRNNPQPTQVALATRNLDILRRVAAYFSGDALAPSYAQALEQGWEAEAGLLLTMGEAKSPDMRMPPKAVLRTAAKKGWLRAIDQVMQRHPKVLSDKSPSDWQGSPLAVAIKADQTEALTRLLKENVGPLVLLDAALVAAKSAKPHLLPLLWDRLERKQQSIVLVQMAIEQWGPALDWTWAHFTPETLVDLWTKDPDLRANTLAKSVAGGRVEWVNLLLPLTDPKANKSEALRVAVEQGNDAMVDLLLPLSEPKAVRKTWLSQSPPRWPLVDRLGLHLPPDQQAAWCNRPDQLPQMMAARRAAQTAPLTDAAPARRRLRS